MYSRAVPIGKGSPTIYRRVDAKILVDVITGCWEWTGAYSKKRNGHRPVVRLGGHANRVVLVSRLQLTRYVGPPPSYRHEAGHTCPAGENAKCVNPEHLKWQTRMENEHCKRR